MFDESPIALSGDVSTTMPNQYSKELEYFNRLYLEKYTSNGQTREDHINILANNLASDYTHYTKLREILYLHRFLPAGRVQAALGTVGRDVSPFNCSVSQRIDDDRYSIMSSLSNAFYILRLGTGWGGNFSHIRPEDDLIKSLQAAASGPISFMNMFDAMCATVRSAGHRRGAMMAILNVGHPDIEKFIDAKMEKGKLTNFNISVGITDEFMKAVELGNVWHLRFNGEIRKTLPAKQLWEKIIRNAYESAEPGIINLSALNKSNNLNYCEEIEATNPCSEQPLPPYGLCLLGSFNLPAYLYKKDGKIHFDSDTFTKDIPVVVEALDNIFDEAIYAIPEHKEEALNKRRMGIGLTGIANAIELMLGMPSYGNEEFCLILQEITNGLAWRAYQASVELAKKRGPFKLFDRDKYLSGNSFAATKLPDYIQNQIYNFGIRNSHLISYAPCGTISQIARNVSSGVEPVFLHEMERTVNLTSGKEKVNISDFAYREHNFKGKTINDCSINDHLNVAQICQDNCDSAVSKTVNVPADCSFREYEHVWLEGYKRGLKGLTVYRPTELRGSVIKAVETKIEYYSEPTATTDWKQLELPFNTCANGACER